MSCWCCLPRSEALHAEGCCEQGLHLFSRGWDVEVAWKVTRLPCSSSLEEGWLAHEHLDSITLKSKHCLLLLQV